MTTAVHCRITGRVQGVWYRGWTEREALSLNLDGWVRNRSDGSVEALFAGPREDVRDMIDRCWSGPPLAKVVNIVESEADLPEGEGFHVRR